MIEDPVPAPPAGVGALGPKGRSRAGSCGARPSRSRDG